MANMPPGSNGCLGLGIREQGEGKRRVEEGCRCMATAIIAGA
jgi:hypothetical protein